MKINKYALLIILLINVNQTFAQRFKTIASYKNNGVLVENPDSADFERIISSSDDGSDLFDIKEYYRNKTLKFTGKTSKDDLVILQGPGIWYYPSGVKREEAHYKDSKLAGDNKTYYPNGNLYVHRQYELSDTQAGTTWGAKSLIHEMRDSTGKILAQDANGYYIGYSNDFKRIDEEGPIKNGLKDGEWKGQNGKNTSFTELYNQGFLKQGKFIDENQKVYEYAKRDVYPEFFGGLGEFGKFLGEYIKYPPRAYVAKISGVVVIGFVVERDGALTNLVVKSSPDDDLSNEALRVLRQSPRWVPGKQFGRPVRVTYAVPVRFQL